MKFIGKAILVVVGAVVLLVGFVFFATSGMTGVADDFFAAVDEQDYPEAESMLSDYVKADAAQIYSYLYNNQFNQVQSSSWHAREFKNSKGHIAGEVINGDGNSIPARIDFFKEDGDWKIYAIALQKPNAPSKPSAPSNPDQEALVSTSMSVFIDAARAKSMAAFLQHTSQYWQSQTTVADLDQAFGGIYQAKGDLTFLNSIKPVIESAVIDENNLLVISGYFPMNSSRLFFDQKYIYEAISWQLLAFSYKNESQ